MAKRRGQAGLLRFTRKVEVCGSGLAIVIRSGYEK
jgi:hypothetical protein